MTRKTNARDGLAVALSATADDIVFDEVVKLASDPDNGNSRIFFLLFLGRTRNPESVSALRALAADSFLKQEATAQLEKKRKREDRRRRAPKRD